MLTLRSARLLASAIWSGCPRLGEGYCVLSLGVRVLGYAFVCAYLPGGLCVRLVWSARLLACAGPPRGAFAASCGFFGVARITTNLDTLCD